MIWACLRDVVPPQEHSVCPTRRFRFHFGSASRRSLPSLRTGSCIHLGQRTGVGGSGPQCSHGGAIPTQMAVSSSSVAHLAPPPPLSTRARTHESLPSPSLSNGWGL